MSKKEKLLNWLGIALSLPTAIYAGLSFFFYSWLNTAEPERWPAEKSAIWAYSSLTLAIVFFVIFIFCSRALIKEANRVAGIIKNTISKNEKNYINNCLSENKHITSGSSTAREKHRAS